jgi:glutathione S-transferase
MKLTGISASIRTSKILLVAAEAKVDLEMNNLKSIAETKSAEHLKKNPNGKIPLLETSEGPLYESNAIMYHVARVGGGQLLGQDGL